MHLVVNTAGSLLRAEQDDLEAEIVRSLRLFGRELQLETLNVCMLKGQRLVNLGQWRASSDWIIPALEIDLERAIWWRKRLREPREIIIDAASKLPLEATYEQHLLSSRKIQSLAAFPLLQDGLLCGYLIAEDRQAVDRWSPERMSTLDLLANLLGAALVQRARDRTLIDRARTAQRHTDRQSQLLTTFAHELRAPLTAVTGYAEMVATGLAGPISDQQADYLADLLASAQHMSELIQNTLQLARLDCGDVSLTLTHFLIVDMLQDALRHAVPRAQSLGITLVPELPDSGERVFGDRQKLTQLVTNLLDNALKFTPGSGRITLRLGMSADHYDIEVEDTGIGIPESDQQRIFERFEQFPGREPLHGSSGVGLGLTLVKRLAELHEGAVTLSSTPGQGSCFRVTLKRRPVPSALGIRPL